MKNQIGICKQIINCGSLVQNIDIETQLFYKVMCVSGVCQQRRQVTPLLYAVLWS